MRSRLVASDSCPGPEFFSKFPFHSHPKRKSRRQMSAACACSSLAVGSTAIAAAPRPHPRLGPERADDRHQPQHSILRSGRHLPTQAPCGHAARPTQSGTNGHMQTESRDSFIAPWEVTVGDLRIVAVCAVAGEGPGAFLRPRGGILCPSQGFCLAWWLGKGEMLDFGVLGRMPGDSQSGEILGRQ